MLITSRQGRLLRATGEAERAFASGILRVSAFGRIGSSNPGSDRLFQCRFRDEAPVLAPFSTRRAGQNWIITELPEPVAASIAGCGDALAFHIERRPAPKRDITELLKVRYGLTKAEASIAALLKEGVSVKAIAEQRSGSEATVRTHIKSILHKTGTKRQAELVALLHRIVA
nr:helix-turn-helix transcriptional regulator [Aurantimonas sp. VKM B-3413]